MANNEHLDILMRGVSFWNEWRDKNLDILPDLRRTNLAGMDLSNANLNDTNLNEVVLDNANLYRARLRSTKLNNSSLHKVNFTKADLHKVGLRYSIVTYSDLSKSNLNEAVFAETDIQGSDFSKAHMSGTIFNDVDLSTVKGLDTIKHFGPSVIDIATLYKSGNNIPEIFLRGCGIPDYFISFIPSYLNAQQAVEFYSCFISYSTKDEEFAKKLHSRMQAEHLRVWFAPEDIKGGLKIFEQIETAIQSHDKLLLVLSESSIQSEWVITEIRNARRTEMSDKRRKFFPIRLVDFERIKSWKCFDSESGKDLAIEVREYFIPDFSNWQDNSVFELAFDRLMRDLRAEESK